MPPPDKAPEIYVIDEKQRNKEAAGFALANVTGFTLDDKSSGGVNHMLVLRLELQGGRVVTFKDNDAKKLYKELRKLAIVV